VARLRPRKLEPEELELADLEIEIDCEVRGMTREQYEAEQLAMIDDLRLMEYEAEQAAELRQFQKSQEELQDADDEEQRYLDRDGWDDFEPDPYYDWQSSSGEPPE